MTTQMQPATPPPVPSQELHRLHSPGELAAALPALFGFRPAQSIAVVCLAASDDVPGAARISVVLRHDLSIIDTKPAPDMAAALTRLAALCAQEGASSAIVFLIDGNHDGTRPGRDHTHAHETIAAELAIGLAEYAITLLGAHAVNCIGAGARWWSLLGDDRAGTVPDPASSRLAAANVYAGRAIYDSRASLTALLTPDLATCARVQQLLEAGGPQPGRQRLLRYVIDCAAAGLPAAPAPGQLATLATGLAAADVRDALYALATSALADPAERLWLSLTRLLPVPWRAHAAALLAFSAYARGDGPFTGIALAAALQADPHHRMAGLLLDALRTGMRPEAIRQLGQTSHESGLALGAVMPAQLPGQPC